MIIHEKTELSFFQGLEPVYFDDMVKIVIDRRRKLVAAHAEMHSDLGIELYDDGSEEEDLFGANIMYDDHSIVWTSTLNVIQNRRLQTGTRGRIITDEIIISELTEIINQWIYR